ncbi:ASKHA domain-containing protein [Sporohalobacter salinus]|uniref:ASKHA domain-containing protein n=1 Tax=Sporohalobacter salinus TaxID=1494606 RepID=UPI0019602E9D|nr:ASKHA domain-containing protein [Sporohalobacter salinus]MBM7625041.1 uncharacterized 2Fe-2S/4Fe-4S cluster protein (DUF4445 family) [Sporohalobacter salinus]
MVEVKFKNESKSIEVKEGTKLSECIRKAGFEIETPCNCMGTCGKCKVKVKGKLSTPSSEEKKFIDESKGIRLACRAEVKGAVEIELLRTDSDLKGIENEYLTDIEIDSGIKKVLLSGIEVKESTPYLETIDYKAKSVNIYEKIGKLEKEKQVTDELYGIIYNSSLLDINYGFENVLGVAVDIGTTGLSIYLVDLETGEILNSISSLNPQTQFGGDVLSRITYCMENSDGASSLKKIIINKINEVIEELLEDKFSKSNIYRVIIAGNTTMLHLFAGVNPTSLAKAPYRPVFLNKIDLDSLKLGIDINKDGIVTLLPSASSYVGSDILAGIVATGFDKKEHSSIFIDIGTNGEIVLISDGNMAATSTAAGPALEGMNISCGSRAQKGAIDTFKIDEDFNFSYTTIDDVEATGICGSGLIDIVASLVKSEIVLSTGRFNKDLNKKVADRLQNKKLYVTDDVYITQGDIRQIQLAKGAIATGVTMLLKEIGISIKDIGEAVIAGAFGYHVNPKSIKEIGLIPKGFSGKITFVGNSSAQGARQALINEDILNKMVNIKEDIEVLELSTREKFQEYFVKELRF